MTMCDAEKGGFISKVIGDKRRWRQYKARVRRLPPDYRMAV
jgi:DNA-binding ferritin-like protein (Dps family)